MNIFQLQFKLEMSLGKLFRAFLTLLMAFKPIQLTNSLLRASGKMWNRKRISILFLRLHLKKAFPPVAEKPDGRWPSELLMT